MECDWCRFHVLITVGKMLGRDINVCVVYEFYHNMTTGSCNRLNWGALDDDDGE